MLNGSLIVHPIVYSVCQNAVLDIIVTEYQVILSLLNISMLKNYVYMFSHFSFRSNIEVT